MWEWGTAACRGNRTTQPNGSAQSLVGGGGGGNFGKCIFNTAVVTAVLLFRFFFFYVFIRVFISLSVFVVGQQVKEAHEAG